jgi:hypothetical protein
LQLYIPLIPTIKEFEMKAVGYRQSLSIDHPAAL